MVDHSGNKTPALGNILSVKGVEPKRECFVLFLSSYFLLIGHMFSQILQMVSVRAFH